MGEERHIVSRHWLRRTAREERRHVERLQSLAGAPDVQGTQRELARTTLKGLGLTEAAIAMGRFTVERAGRIRARWAVVCEW